MSELTERLRMMRNKAAEEAADEIERLTAQRDELLAALKTAKPIYATAKNSEAVRKGYEMGGYVTHYELARHVVHEAIAKAESHARS